MPSLSSGIQIALQAVLAHSQSIETIEHNVANANTKGYHRQTARLGSTGQTPIYNTDYGAGGGGSVHGTGVTVEQIQRYSLEFFDTRFRSATADAKSSALQKQTLDQLEATLSETSTDGVLPRLDDFFSNWQALASDPNNVSLRANVMNQAGELTNSLNRRAQQLIQLRSDQDSAVTSRVDEVNRTASKIAELNGEITRVLSTNEQPNDLLDQRDLMLDRLSELTGATSSIQADGRAIVSIGGHVLVTGNTALELTTRPDGNNLSQVVWKDNTQPLNVSSGELSGILKIRDQVIPQQQTALDKIASGLVSGVNALHKTGFGRDGSTGNNFFDPTATSALSIKLNAGLTAEKLAVASAAGEAGNSVIASAISALKDANLVAANGAAAPNQTLHQFYAAQIVDLGLTVQRAKDGSAHQATVANSLGAQRDSVSGVSLDEEAAEIMKSQKAYQAAAKIMTVYDDLMDRIINGMIK